MIEIQKHVVERLPMNARSRIHNTHYMVCRTHGDEMDFIVPHIRMVIQDTYERVCTISVYDLSPPHQLVCYKTEPISGSIVPLYLVNDMNGKFDQILIWPNCIVCYMPIQHGIHRSIPAESRIIL